MPTSAKQKLRIAGTVFGAVAAATILALSVFFIVTAIQCQKQHGSPPPPDPENDDDGSADGPSASTGTGAGSSAGSSAGPTPLQFTTTEGASGIEGTQATGFQFLAGASGGIYAPNQLVPVSTQPQAAPVLFTVSFAVSLPTGSNNGFATSESSSVFGLIPASAVSAGVWNAVPQAMVGVSMYGDGSFGLSLWQAGSSETVLLSAAQVPSEVTITMGYNTGDSSLSITLVNTTSRTILKEAAVSVPTDVYVFGVVAQYISSSGAFTVTPMSLQ